MAGITAPPWRPTCFASKATALKHPLLEAFMLDSASCAACTYMWAMVLYVKKEFGEKIDVAEYKYTSREGIARCKKVGIKNLPSLYIYGKLAYASIIPGHEELYAKSGQYSERQ